MRSISVLAIALLTVTLLAGCTPSAADQLVGTWVVDADAMKTTDDYKKASDEEKKMMEGMLGMMKMELTFTKDKVTMNMDMMGQKKTDEKSYTVKSTDGNQLILTSKTDDGKDEDVTVVIDGDVLTFKSADQSLALKRKS